MGCMRTASQRAWHRVSAQYRVILLRDHGVLPAHPRAPAVQGCPAPPAKKQRRITWAERWESRPPESTPNPTRLSPCGGDGRGASSPESGLGDSTQMAATEGHWDRPCGPGGDPSHPCPPSGPGRLTRHAGVYIACGPFTNPLHFVGWKLKLGEVSCWRSYSQQEVGLGLERKSG